MLSLNCCSVRPISLSKRGKPLTVIEESNVDIIIECESHIDNLFTSTEFFLLTLQHVFVKIVKLAVVYMCFFRSVYLKISEQPSLDSW